MRWKFRAVGGIIHIHAVVRACSIVLYYNVRNNLVDRNRFFVRNRKGIISSGHCACRLKSIDTRGDVALQVIVSSIIPRAEAYACLGLTYGLYLDSNGSASELNRTSTIPIDEGEHVARSHIEGTEVAGRDHRIVSVGNDPGR